jgi:hypothetical protein
MAASCVPSWMKFSPASVPAQAMQLCVALRMRILASSYGCTEATSSAPTRSHSGRPAAKLSSTTHWMKLSPVMAAASSRPVAAFTRARNSGGGRGVMRSTMALGQRVFAFTQASRSVSPARAMNSSSPRESGRRCGAGCRSSAA